ncbi:hypothetical protein BHE74_00010510 [Ensete ventricosum]|nr:hypothetical protein GW17_00028671 [Ensete ventricosum]RWW81122.1 hypothetical protein BHE74_00010510 [Ensete ventricosum]RZS26235.1 hypothetical protein BHM03_00059550 [Ensete ventricosum]
MESWVKVIKRGNAFEEFLMGLAALPPMDQKPQGIALKRTRTVGRCSTERIRSVEGSIEAIRYSAFAQQ